MWGRRGCPAAVGSRVGLPAAPHPAGSGTDHTHLCREGSGPHGSLLRALPPHGHSRWGGDRLAASRALPERAQPPAREPPSSPVHTPPAPLPARRPRRHRGQTPGEEPAAPRPRAALSERRPDRTGPGPRGTAPCTRGDVTSSRCANSGKTLNGNDGRPTRSLSLSCYFLQRSPGSLTTLSPRQRVRGAACSRRTAQPRLTFPSVAPAQSPLRPQQD